MAIHRDAKRSLGGNEYLAKVLAQFLAMKIIRLALLLFILLTSACVSTRTADVPEQAPADVEDRVIVDGKVLPLPDQNVVKTEPLSGQRTMSPVVRTLMTSAQNQRSAGNWDGAASSLERALRIEPRNATLWGRLADVRYAQKSWRKAIQLAAKSNTLAGSDQMLRRQNWYLMANAYEALDDPISSQKYRAKLSR